jgi:lactate dehydrogenase-like 2-hydroxyacid dehydrogenase
MNNTVNNKRVFLVTPHVPNGYLDILGKRDDVRLDKLDNGGLTEPAKSVLAAAHAYQTGSTRDELVRHYHTGAELLGHTPNLLIVSTNGAGYDTVNVKACTERGILVVNQSGGNAESVAEHVLAMLLSLVKRVVECDRALRAGTLTDRGAFTGPRRTARPSASSASAMSAAVSPNYAAACSAWTCWPMTPMSTPMRPAGAAPAKSNSMSFCAAPISSRSIAR